MFASFAAICFSQIFHLNIPLKSGLGILPQIPNPQLSSNISHPFALSNIFCTFSFELFGLARQQLSKGSPNRYFGTYQKNNLVVSCDK
jgi:hypothetical protein